MVTEGEANSSMLCCNDRHSESVTYKVLGKADLTIIKPDHVLHRQEAATVHSY